MERAYWLDRERYIAMTESVTRLMETSRRIQLAKTMYFAATFLIMDVNT